MTKRAIFFASTAAGLALFGTIGFMQLDPRAFTSDSRVNLDTYLYGDIPAPAAVPRHDSTAAEPAVMVMPELKVTSDIADTLQSPTPLKPVSAPPAPREAITPCSPWREVGPRQVTDGVPAGTIHVRSLC